MVVGEASWRRVHKSESAPSKSLWLRRCMVAWIPYATYWLSMTKCADGLHWYAQTAAQSSARPTVCLPGTVPEEETHLWPLPQRTCQVTAQEHTRRAGSDGWQAAPSLHTECGNIRWGGDQVAAPADGGSQGRMRQRRVAAGSLRRRLTVSGPVIEERQEWNRGQCHVRCKKESAVPGQWGQLGLSVQCRAWSPVTLPPARRERRAALKGSVWWGLRRSRKVAQ